MKTAQLIKYSLLVAMIFLSVATLKAQQALSVRGKVLDSKDKQGVISASVQEIDADKRVITAAKTDIDGNFFISVKNPNNLLQVSFIGYKTQQIVINKRTEINVLLVPIATDLSEIAIKASKKVDNGTGFNIDERNNTLATSSINQKDLEELSAQSIDQALQGRLPGVDISTSSGDPGAPMSIRIRGTASLNGSAQPLIVVDNVPYETEIPPDFNFSTADEQGYAQLLNIAPSDIQTITVLKDAASTAIWGSRGANGVLVIVTKRGVVGPPQVTYVFTGVLRKQPESIPLLTGDQYSSLIPEEIANAGNLPLDQLKNPEFNYDPLSLASYYNYSNNTDWVKAITQLGYTQTHNVNMQGGGEKASYYISFGYSNTKGSSIGTDLKNINTKISLDYTVSNKIRFRTDFLYAHINQLQNYGGDVRGIAYTKIPNMSIYEYDEYGNLTPNYFSPAANIQGQYSSTYNPVAMANTASNRNLGDRVTPHFNLRYQILPNVLTALFDIQYDINNNKTKQFLPQIATGRPATETNVNRASDSDGDQYTAYGKATFSFTPKINSDKHTFTALLALSAQDKSTFSQSIITSNTASSSLQDVADPARTQNGDLSLTGTNGKSRTLNGIFQANYSFLDRYVLGFSANFDGSSAYGPNNRTRLFPAISTKWHVFDEPFLKPLTKVFDDLAVRVSYGLTGGGSGGSFFNTYVPTSYSYVGISGIIPGNIGLDNLKPQITHGLNVGLDIAAFKQKFRITVDAYRNRITDLFFNGLQIPTYTGYSSISANVGVQTNKGIEVSFNTIPVKTKNWNLGVDFNFAKNINVINEVSEYFPRTDGLKINTNGKYRTFLQVGNPFGSFYGFKYLGVYKDKDATIATDPDGNKVIGPNGQIIYTRFNFPATDYTFQPGDAQYADINHDGNINEADIVYLGNGNPKVTGGFGTKLTFKGNVSLSTNFNYKFGYQLVNQTLMNTTNMSGYNNQSTRVLQRWRNPGDVTDVPRAYYNGGYNWLGSDRYVSDGSFVRLQSVVIRYNMTKTMLNKLKMKQASIYMTFENLYTWTKYLGVDPDVGSSGPNSPFSVIVDNSRTPPTKNVLLGINVGFQ